MQRLLIELMARSKPSTAGRPTSSWSPPVMHSLYIKVADGINYTLNFEGDRRVKEYLTSQGKFNHLKDPDIDQIQKMVDAEWNLRLRKAGMTSS